MVKRIVLSFFVAMCVLTVGSSVREARAAGDKIDVCHVPPGNPANAHTISVGSQAALAAHLAHGDTQGECNSGAACRDFCIAVYDIPNCAPDEQSCQDQIVALLAQCL